MCVCVCVGLAVPLERVQLFFKNELAHSVGPQEPTQPEILFWGPTVRLGMQLNLLLGLLTVNHLCTLHPWSQLFV